MAPGILRSQLPIFLPGPRPRELLLPRGRARRRHRRPRPARAAVVAGAGRPPQAGRATSPKDVHTVVVTHSHPDHFGGAGRFRDSYGAEVVTPPQLPTWFDPRRGRRSTHRRGRRARRRPRRRPFGRADAVAHGPDVLARRCAGACASRLMRARRPRASCAPRRPPGACDDGEVDHARRPRVGVAAHAGPHRRPPLPVRPRRGRRALRRPRAAHDHAAHLRPGRRRRPAHRVLRLARQGGRRSRACSSCCPPTATRSTTCAGRAEEIREHHEERLDTLREAAARARRATVEELHAAPLPAAVVGPDGRERDLRPPRAPPRHRRGRVRAPRTAPLRYHLRRVVRSGSPQRRDHAGGGGDRRRRPAPTRESPPSSSARAPRSTAAPALDRPCGARPRPAAAPRRSPSRATAPPRRSPSRRRCSRARARRSR